MATPPPQRRPSGALAWPAAPLVGLQLTSIVFLARRRKDHLELEARRLLFEQVQAYPGLHLSELARACELGTNHAKYHLLYLEDHGLVSSRKEDGYWRFYPRTEGDIGLRDVLGVQEKRILGLLRKPVPLHVTVLLMDKREATASELGEHVDVSTSTLHYHLTKMEKEGHLVSRKEGRERFYQLAEEDLTARLLIEYRPPDKLVEGFLEAWEQLEF